jgi:hypothetical protein
VQPTNMKPLGFGEVLDGAFQIFRRHFVVLALTTLLPSGLSAILTIAATSRISADPGEMSGVWLAFFPVWIGVVCLTLIVWGALSWQTSEAWLGSAVTFGDGLRAGARSFFRLLGSAILAYILLWVGMIVLMIPIGILAAILIPAMASGGGGSALSGVLILLMVPVLLIVWVAVAGLISFTLPAVVVEGLGPFRAISRSIELAKGAVIRNGLLIVVSFLIVMLPAVAVILLTGGLAGFTNPGAPVPTTMIIVQQLAGMAVGSFTTPFLAAVITVAYYDRRVRTEALDVHLAATHLGTEPEPAAT